MENLELQKEIEKQNEKQRWRKWHIVLFDEELTKDDIFNQFTFKQTHYCIIGEEQAPTTNKKHFHIYIEFDNACTMSSIKKLFPKAHIEKANGTASQNKVYITKDDKDYKEYGSPTSIKYNNDDIASNIIIAMLDNVNIELMQIACDVPEFADYIVKNYHALAKIQSDLQFKVQREKIEQEQQQRNSNEDAI